MNYVFMTTDSWWMVLLGYLAQLGLAFAAPILSVLGYFAIRWILKKLKVSDLEQQELLHKAYEKAIEAGINYANQLAHKLKDNPKMGSAKKLEAAMKFVESMIKDAGLPGKSSAWIKNKIESKLGEDKK